MSSTTRLSVSEESVGAVFTNAVAVAAVEDAVDPAGGRVGDGERQPARGERGAHRDAQHVHHRDGQRGSETIAANPSSRATSCGARRRVLEDFSSSCASTLISTSVSLSVLM